MYYFQGCIQTVLIFGFKYCIIVKRFAWVSSHETTYTPLLHNTLYLGLSFYCIVQAVYLDIKPWNHTTTLYVLPSIIWVLLLCCKAVCLGVNRSYSAGSFDGCAVKIYFHSVFTLRELLTQYVPTIAPTALTPGTREAVLQEMDQMRPTRCTAHRHAADQNATDGIHGRVVSCCMHNPMKRGTVTA